MKYSATRVFYQGWCLILMLLLLAPLGGCAIFSQLLSDRVSSQFSGYRSVNSYTHVGGSSLLFSFSHHWVPGKISEKSVPMQTLSLTSGSTGSRINFYTAGRSRNEALRRLSFDDHPDRCGIGFGLQMKLPRLISWLESNAGRPVYVDVIVTPPSEGFSYSTVKAGGRLLSTGLTLVVVAPLFESEECFWNNGWIGDLADTIAHEFYHIVSKVSLGPYPSLLSEEYNAYIAGSCGYLVVTEFSGLPRKTFPGLSGFTDEFLISKWIDGQVPATVLGNYLSYKTLESLGVEGVVRVCDDIFMSRLSLPS